MYWPWTSPQILRGASSSSSMGCERRMGLTRLHISLISSSEMEARVPGGLPRRASRRLQMHWIGLGGGGGVAGVSGGCCIGSGCCCC